MAARKAAPKGHGFTLAGHDFTAKPDLPLGAYVVFVRKSSTGYGAQVLAADDLVRAWLPDDQHPAWDAALNVTSDLDELIGVVDKLIVVATGRPTAARAS